MKENPSADNSEDGGETYCNRSSTRMLIARFDDNIIVMGQTTERHFKQAENEKGNQWYDKQ